MTTDPFTEAAEHEADLVTEDGDNAANGGFVAGALWARDHLTARRAEEVRAWAVQQYPSGTPLDQDRRMVAAETEAYLSGRTEREMSELAQATKHAGPVDPPTAQEPTDAEVEAAAEGMWDRYGNRGAWKRAPDHLRRAFRADARAALPAARNAGRAER